MRCFLILILTLGSISSFAQQQFPPVSADVDAHLEDAYVLQAKKDSSRTNLLMDAVDARLLILGENFPLYRGVIHLFQAFYVLDSRRSDDYQRKAIRLLSGHHPVLADSFSRAFYNVMQLFNKAGRMAEWKKPDSVFRAALLQPPNTDPVFSILNYSIGKLNQKEYALARNLALYDYYVIINKEHQGPWERLNLMYNDWVITKTDLDQWLSLSYEERFPEEYQVQGGRINIISAEKAAANRNLRSQDFNSIFKKLFSRLNELKQEFVLQNDYSNKNVIVNLRKGYYDIYLSLLKGYYDWARSEHKEGLAILPYREFLYQDLIPNEFRSAEAAGVRPAVNGYQYTDVVTQLSYLYHTIGNGMEEMETVMRAYENIVNQKLFSSKEGDYGLVQLLKARISANRLQHNFEASLMSSRSLKIFRKKPSEVKPDDLLAWDDFMDARVEEVYTLLSANRTEAARDSLSRLLEQINPLDDGTDFAPLYKTQTWPSLQYLVALLQAQNGKWMPTMLQESIMDMEAGTHFPEIYYPVQLLYLKALWKEEKKLPPSLMSNLLFYTGRQLRYTYPMISADDRMRLYEQKLNPIFDVYHELLFSGMLDSFPDLKEKVIAQSLTLKNALGEGSLVSNETLLKKQNYFSEDKIEQLRELKNDISLQLQKSKFRKYDRSQSRVLQDRVQNLWLSLLEDSGMDSLTRFTDWRQIGRALKKGQVFTETVRYNKWLSDSSAHYAAYIITGEGEIRLVPLFAEKKLANLLKDPTASAQSSIFSDAAHRGGIVINRKAPPVKKYKKGDPDQLADYIISPFWKYIQNSTGWIMVQDGLLNRVSFAALDWKGKNIFEWVELRQLAGSNSLLQAPMQLPVKGQALLAGGLQYGTPHEKNKNRLFKKNYSWNYLPGTRKEVESLKPLFESSFSRTVLVSGEGLPDSLLRNLKDFQFIHLATHGFYLDSSEASAAYDVQWNREAVQYEPLFRCGIAMSRANDPDTSHSETEGYLLGYELAHVDLRSCYLVSLSACETGLGDLRNNLGVDGLSRALKLSGARHLLISLWKVPDEPTAVFMMQFYNFLFSGNSPASALRKTQAVMNKTHVPKDWAAFVLVE